jgi:branched-chain amino acid transport system substrate-binding protein
MARQTLLRSDFLAGLGAATVAATTPYEPQITPSIMIGLCAPFSGDAKPVGDRLSAGVQAAITSTNQLAGTLSQTFALRTFDDQNRVANAMLQASFATGDSSIVAMIGHVSSAATLQAIPTYGAAQMPLIVPLCTDDRITATQYHCVFRLPTKDSFEGDLFAHTVLAEVKPKRPYVFVQNADYGADVANGFINAMNAQKVPVQYQQFAYSGADFGHVVDVALAQQPDYAFLAGIVGDMGPIVGVLRAKGYTGPIGASQGFFDPATAQLGSAANGMTISTSMPYLPLAPTTVRARTEFEAHFGTLDSFAAFGYAATQIIIAAVQRSNANARNTLVSAIQQGVPIDTMVGTYSFGAFGDALQPQIYYYTVRDGKFTYLHQARPSGFMIK